MEEAGSGHVDISPSGLKLIRDLAGAIHLFFEGTICLRAMAEETFGVN